MSNITYDSRLRIDFQDDKGNLLLTTYHFNDKKIEIDFRYKGALLRDKETYLLVEFAKEVIETINVSLTTKDMTTIERS